ncbi:sensor histidine kinase [Nocardioides speluncae]|uniref:sensor histidine kinase n=1 Tax=Nocardioides speluncae TaxID=2670337 RepID=UPI0012B16FAB|nr:histidine kinase [Nocardioides speluncae]
MTLQDLRIDSVAPTGVTRESLLYRLRMTGLSAGYTLAAVPALVLLILTVVGLPLVFAVGAGLLLVWLAVPATALLTRAHRAVSGAVLGTEIEAGYADDRGRNFLTRPWVWLRDPARWRDVAFLAFSATGGFVLSLAPVALLTAPIAHVSVVLFLDHSLWWLPVFISTPMLIAWWFVSLPLVRARALAERGILDHGRVEELERRVEEVSTSRSEVLDHNAAEIRRIERDLHDGAQAQLVAIGMNASYAEKMIEADPAIAVEVLRELRLTTVSALENLRSVVRGIHPPALAELGLVGGIESLAAPLPLPVTVAASLPGHPPAPVETAVYFGVAECLANVVKHAKAEQVEVTLSHGDGVLRVVVRDDGIGDASAAPGSGLDGLARRMSAFDGIVTISSPTGGPTVVTMEVPCALSSLRTKPYSEKPSSDS